MNNKETLIGIISTAIINKTKLQIDQFVLSCRVFDRNLEYGIYKFLLKIFKTSKFDFNYKRTFKNTAFQKFIKNVYDNNILNFSGKVSLK